MFPNDVLEYMIKKADDSLLRYPYLTGGLSHTKQEKDIDKKNQMFGFYRHVGQIYGYWTFDEIEALLTGIPLPEKKHGRKGRRMI